jgi:hypothetical protein
VIVREVTLFVTVSNAYPHDMTGTKRAVDDPDSHRKRFRPNLNDDHIRNVPEPPGIDTDEESEAESEDFSLSEITGNSDLSRLSSKPMLETNPPSATCTSSFLSMGVSSSLRTALSNMSIRTPTEVQAACIPPILAGKSCLRFLK